MRKLILTIENDSCTDNPLGDNGEWEMVSFDRCHRGFHNREEFDDIGFRRKLETGTAFLLDYYEHGNCVWSRHGAGPQCRWDTSQGAGFLIWKGDRKYYPKTFEERAKWADSALEEYTSWCNGECYYFSLTTSAGVDVESCGGYIGSDHLLSCLRHDVLKEGDYVHVTGECKWIADSDKDLAPAKYVKHLHEFPVGTRVVESIRIVLDGPDGPIYWPKYVGENDIDECELSESEAFDVMRNGIPFVVALAEEDDEKRTPEFAMLSASQLQAYKPPKLEERPARTPQRGSRRAVRLLSPRSDHAEDQKEDSQASHVGNDSREHRIQENPAHQTACAT